MTTLRKYSVIDVTWNNIYSLLSLGSDLTPKCFSVRLSVCLSVWYSASAKVDCYAESWGVNKKEGCNIWTFEGCNIRYWASALKIDSSPTCHFWQLAQHLSWYPVIPDHDSMNNPSRSSACIVILFEFIQCKMGLSLSHLTATLSCLLINQVSAGIIYFLSLGSSLILWAISFQGYAWKVWCILSTVRWFSCIHLHMCILWRCKSQLK